MSGVRFGGLAGGTDDPDLAATSTADNCTSVADDCSLRGATTKSNTLITTDTIEFDIPDSPEPRFEVKTISLGTRLPAIADNVTINGYAQPGAVPNDATTNANSAVLKVETDGAGLGSAGLTLSGEGAVGSVIRGLVINRFDGSGVFAAAASAVVRSNFIGTDPSGTDPSGTVDRGNGNHGVRVTSPGNLIGSPANAAQNLISGNEESGVSVAGRDVGGASRGRAPSSPATPGTGSSWTTSTPPARGCWATL